MIDCIHLDNWDHWLNLMFGSWEYIKGTYYFYAEQQITVWEYNGAKDAYCMVKGTEA